MSTFPKGHDLLGDPPEPPPQEPVHDMLTVPSLAEQQAMEDEEPCFGQCDGCGRRDAPLFRSLTGYRCETCLHAPVIGRRIP